MGGFHRRSHAVWTQSQPRGGYLGNHGSPPLQAQNGHARHVWHHAAVLARGENLEKQSFCGFVFIPNILNEVLWGIVPKRFLSAPLLHFIFQICFLSSFYCPVLTCILSWFRQIVLTGFLFTNNWFICFIENILPQYRYNIFLASRGQRKKPYVDIPTRVDMVNLLGMLLTHHKDM